MTACSCTGRVFTNCGCPIHDPSISTANWDERELDLFDAFLAGFDVAGEGFNGEYVDQRYRGHNNEEFRQRMLKGFVAWRNGKDVC